MNRYDANKEDLLKMQLLELKSDESNFPLKDTSMPKILLAINLCSVADFWLLNPQ